MWSLIDTALLKELVVCKGNLLSDDEIDSYKQQDFNLSEKISALFNINVYTEKIRVKKSCCSFLLLVIRENFLFFAQINFLSIKTLFYSLLQILCLAELLECVVQTSIDIPTTC